MERCTRCSGAVLADGDEWGKPAPRCVNCGRPPGWEKGQKVEQTDTRIIVGRVAPAPADPLAEYERAARLAIELHEQWQAAQDKATELHKQAAQAWVKAQNARARLDEFWERYNVLQPALPEPEPEPAPKRRGPKQSPETIAKRMATIAARRAAKVAPTGE